MSESPRNRSSSKSRRWARGVARFDHIAFGFLFFRAIASIAAYLVLAIWFSDKLDYRFHVWVILASVYTFFGTWAFRSSRSTQAKVFAIFLMCTAGAYSASNILRFGSAVPNLKLVAEILGRTRFEFFLAWYSWRFLEYFPGTYEPPVLARIRRAFQAASLLICGFYFLLGQLDYILGMLPGRAGFFTIGIWHLTDTAWYYLMPLAFMSMLGVFYRVRGAVGEVKRRVSLFGYALVLGFGPQTFKNSLELFFAREQLFFPTDPEGIKVTFLTFNSLILIMPFISFYAVLANRVLDVRQLARSAIQYLLARYSATAFAVMPFVLLVVLLIQNRNSPLVEVFTGTKAILLTGLTVLGIILMRFRRVLVDAIDRRFFRDRYNARVVLTDLAEKVRGTRNLIELSKLVGSGVDLALHLDRVSLLALDSAHGRYVDPLGIIRPLDTASKLTTLLQGSREPLVVEFDDPRSPLHDLSDSDKQWLVDGSVELLSPAHALDGNLIGILALGRKKSEEPFAAEDRDLVKGVCSSTGLVIELLQLKEQAPATNLSLTPEMPSAQEISERPAELQQVARECLACSRVYPPSEDRCPKCVIELEPTVVPYVLRGQYRFESRLGTGGMAVVYRATDLRLGREVAIKTLPQVSPEAAMRLHREARTAATVTDSGLAAIYGIETWEGMPLLIQEFLKGGTLSDQLLAGRPLTPAAAIEVGKTVASALQKIHSVGILHRDLKPSNIGYTQDGQAKLLDFGVARIHQDWRQDVEAGGVEEELDGRSRIQNTASWVIARTATGQLVGTVGYLSPEAVMGHRPEPSVDLWALSVVLWESLAGVNLFTGRSFQIVLEKIRDVKLEKLTDYMEGCPQPLVDFFARELHPDKMKRARSGREMVERLEQLRLDLDS